MRSQVVAVIYGQDDASITTGSVNRCDLTNIRARRSRASPNQNRLSAKPRAWLGEEVVVAAAAGLKGGNVEDEMNWSYQLTSLLATPPAKRQRLMYVRSLRAPSLGRLIASMKMRLRLHARNVVCVIGRGCRMALRPFSCGGCSVCWVRPCDLCWQRRVRRTTTDKRTRANIAAHVPSRVKVVSCIYCVFKWHRGSAGITLIDWHCVGHRQTGHKAYT